MKHIPSIRLHNGHEFSYMIASGALAFDGKGWLWERPLVGLGLIDTSLFTVVLKTLTLEPLAGNLSWLHPWSCVSLVSGGSVNRIGLTNPGIKAWCDQFAPRIVFEDESIVVSIFGSKTDLVAMARMLNRYNLKAIEVNYSCPNTGHALSDAQDVVDAVIAVQRVTRHPIIIKVSVSQPYLEIAAGLADIASAVSINSVPWEKVFPESRSPLWKLEQKLGGGGGGGVSGQPAQLLNWKAVKELAAQDSLPVIGPSVMEYEDMMKVRSLGAQAVSFGAIHLPSYPVWKHPFSLFTNPCKPTQFIRMEQEL